jgi:hypothetical protein
MCIYAWARFDLLSIGLGMGLLALSCACMVLTFSACTEGNDDLRSSKAALRCAVRDWFECIAWLDDVMAAAGMAISWLFI